MCGHVRDFVRGPCPHRQGPRPPTEKKEDGVHPLSHTPVRPPTRMSGDHKTCVCGVAVTFTVTTTLGMSGANDLPMTPVARLQGQELRG